MQKFSWQILLSMAAFSFLCLWIAWESIPAHRELVYVFEKSKNLKKLLPLYERELQASYSKKTHEKYVKALMELKDYRADQEAINYLQQHKNPGLLEQILTLKSLNKDFRSLDFWLSKAFDLTGNPVYIIRKVNLLSFLGEKDKQIAPLRLLYDLSHETKWLDTLYAVDDKEFVLNSYLKRKEELGVDQCLKLFQLLVWNQRTEEAFYLGKEKIPLERFDDQKLILFEQMAELYGAYKEVLKIKQHMTTRTPTYPTFLDLGKTFDYYGFVDEAIDQYKMLWKEYKNAQVLDLLLYNLQVNGREMEFLSLKKDFVLQQGNFEDLKQLIWLFTAKKMNESALEAIFEFKKSSLSKNDEQEFRTLLNHIRILKGQEEDVVFDILSNPPEFGTTSELWLIHDKLREKKAVTWILELYRRIHLGSVLKTALQILIHAKEIQEARTIMIQNLDSLGIWETIDLISLFREDPQLHFLIQNILEKKNDPQLWWQLAQTLETFTNTKEITKTVYLKLAKHYPDDLRSIEFLAYQAHGNQNWQEALYWFSLLSQKEPQETRHWSIFAEVLEKNGNSQKADQIYQKILDTLSPLNEQHRLVWLRAALRFKKFEEALSIFREELKKNPEDKDLKQGYFEALLMIENLDELSKNYQGFDPKQENHTGLLRVYAALMQRQNRQKEAIFVLKKIETLNQEQNVKDPWLHADLGSSLSLQSKKEEAMSEYKKALQGISDPVIFQAWKDLYDSLRHQAYAQMSLANNIFSKNFGYRWRRHEYWYEWNIATLEDWKYHQISLWRDTLKPWKLTLGEKSLFLKLTGSKNFFMEYQKNPWDLSLQSISERAILKKLSLFYSINQKPGQSLLFSLSEHNYENHSGEFARSFSSSFSLFKTIDSQWSFLASYDQELLNFLESEKTQTGLGDYKALNLRAEFRKRTNHPAKPFAWAGVSQTFPDFFFGFGLGWDYKKHFGFSWETSFDPVAHKTIEKTGIYWQRMF